MRSLFCVNSKGARGHKKFIPVWIKGTRCGAKFQRDFPAEIGISSGFSNFKSTKNTNLGLDLRFKAPNLLISSGTVLAWGGTIFVWGGTSSQLGGHGPGMPPRGAGSDFRSKFIEIVKNLNSYASTKFLISGYQSKKVAIRKGTC